MLLLMTISPAADNRVGGLFSGFLQGHMNNEHAPVYECGTWSGQIFSPNSKRPRYFDFGKDFVPLVRLIASPCLLMRRPLSHENGLDVVSTAQVLL